MLFNALTIALVRGREVEEVKRMWVDAIEGVLVSQVALLAKLSYVIEPPHLKQRDATRSL